MVGDTPKKESAPTKALVNVTIGEDWGNYTEYVCLMFCQVMEDTATNKNPNMEYHHALIQSGGHISTTWLLLDNQSTVEIFPNKRLPKTSGGTI